MPCVSWIGAYKSMLKAKLGKLASSKKDLIESVSKEMMLSKETVRGVLIAVVRHIVVELCSGRDVYIMSLGKFFMKRRGKIKINIPSTGKLMTVGERSIPKFAYGRRVSEFIRKEFKKNKGT